MASSVATKESGSSHSPRSPYAVKRNATCLSEEEGEEGGEERGEGRGEGREEGRARGGGARGGRASPRGDLSRRTGAEISHSEAVPPVLCGLASYARASCPLRAVRSTKERECEGECEGECEDVLFVQELLSCAVAPRTGVQLLRTMLDAERRTPKGKTREVHLIARRSDAVSMRFYGRLCMQERLADNDETSSFGRPLGRVFRPRSDEIYLTVGWADLERRLKKLVDERTLHMLTCRRYPTKQSFAVDDLALFRKVQTALTQSHRASTSVGVPTPGTSRTRMPNDPSVRYVVLSKTP